MTDAAPPVLTDNPLNPLEVALYEGLVDHTRMGLFERLMLEADLFASPDPSGPGGAAGDDGAKVLNPGEELLLKGLTLDNGDTAVALFTDPRRVTRLFGEEARILAMKGRNLLQLVGDQPVILNATGGRGLILGPDKVRAVLEHPPVDLKKPTGSVTLTPVPEMGQPAPLILKLRELLATRKVDKAWLARAQWMEEGRMGWYLDVRTDEPADQIRALAERAASGLDFGFDVFDVAVSKPGGEDGVGLQLV